MSLVANKDTINDGALGARRNVRSNDWQFLLAPAGTPANVIARLDTEIRKILSRPDVGKLIFDQGFTLMSMPTEKISEYLKAETLSWQKIVAGSGAKME
jgi:tripartite-type tricarboxylate transporter receptor subunit TctC